jgi:site-specific DNA recombinase
MKNVAIMARVSSDEQAKGYSLEVQKDSLTKFCKNNNLNVSYVIREDHSAKSFNRPAFQEFLQYVKKNKGQITQLLFTSWDRFSRNTSQAFAMIDKLKDLGIECNAIEQPLDMKIPENKLILSVYLTIPEIDNDRRALKIKGGMRAAHKAGRWCKAAPIGYKNSRDEQNKPIIVENEEGKMILDSFKMITEGFSQSQIISKYKGRLTKSNISRILRNPVYLGKIKVPAFENEPEIYVEGLHKGIVNEELFNKVQSLLNNPNRKIVNKIKEWDELPLRGLIECSKCGKTLTGSRSTSKTKRKYFYYHCKCGIERIPAKDINQVIYELLSFVKFPESSILKFKEHLTTIIKNQEGDSIANKKSIEEKISTLNQQQEHLDNTFLKGQIDGEKYGQLNTRIKNEIIELKSKISSITNDENDIERMIQSGLKKMTNFSETLDKVDIQDKRKILSSTFPEKIKIIDGRVRTPRLNSLVQYILLKNSKLQKEKAGQTLTFVGLSRLVEPEGVEPSSNKGVQ